LGSQDSVGADADADDDEVDDEDDEYSEGGSKRGGPRRKFVTKDVHYGRKQGVEDWDDDDSRNLEVFGWARHSDDEADDAG
jgi:hypothetical protein